MPTVTVTNTDANLSAKTLAVCENAQTVSGLWTFSRSTNPPFAVVSGAAKVSNLDADKVDGFEHDQSLLTTANVVFNNIRITANGATPGAGGIYKTANSGIVHQGVTGATADWTITNASDTAAILYNPTGTVNMLFGGRIIVQPGTSSSQGIEFSGNHILRYQSSGTRLEVVNNAGSVFATFGALLAMPAVLTPAQITADQNNYNPSGFSTSSFIRVSSDAARAITGFTAPSDAAGRLYIISNQGSFTITINHLSGSSSAANQVICPGAANYSLTTSKSVMLAYDTTATKWIILGA